MLFRSIGMSALHYYLGGQRSFSDLLKHSGSRHAQFSAKSPAGRVKDLWSPVTPNENVVDLLPYEEIEYPQLQNDDSHEASDRNQQFATYVLPVINHSPGG